MLSATTLVFSAFVAASWSAAEDLTFPPGFKFGVASAAYQVEGAWNVSDKSESIWDRFTHRTPSPIADGSSGDVACDSYHLWQKDVDIVAELGAHYYRLSIAWPRLLPSGFADRISEDGKRYYNNLIDGLLAKGIEPVITLYHWELPQSLQNLGGWTNPLIVDWFADYARVAYTLYGDRVKTWITINEPWVVCDFPYMTEIMAPVLLSPVGAYICTKNVVMAHAKAWKIYDEEFKAKFHGVVSLAQHAIWMEATDEKEEKTAQVMSEFQEGRFSHPIYSKDGGWPPAVEKAFAEFSEKEGYPWSILPSFTKEEIDFVKGSYDFYALNFYNSKMVRRAREGEALTPWPMGDAPLFNAKLQNHPDWPVISEYFNYYPEGLRKELSWLKQQYGDIPILITESGLGTAGGLDDQDRVNYYKNYMKQVLLSIKEDGVNVTGYTAWSIMDNFEWFAGYNTKFGLYEVDFNSPQRTRTPRASAKYFASVIRTRSINAPYNFTTNVATKASKSQDDSSRNIIFGGLILVVIVVIIAAFIGCRVKRRAEAEKKKHRYTAVKADTQNGAQNEVQNSIRDGAQNGTQNGVQIGTQNGVQIGTQNGVQNGTQNGVQNEVQNGIHTNVDESKILLTT